MTDYFQDGQVSHSSEGTTWLGGLTVENNDAMGGANVFLSLIIP